MNVYRCTMSKDGSGRSLALPPWRESAAMPGIVDGVEAGPVPGEAAAGTGLLATRPILPGELLVKETVRPGP